MRRCVEKDREKVMKYLYRNPALNLFIIADLYNFGFDSEFQDLYMDEDEQGIHGLILRFKDSLLVQSYEGKIYPEELARLMKIHTINHISGEASLIDRYALESPNKAVCYFSQCKSLKNAPKTTQVEQFGPEEATELAEVFNKLFKDSHIEASELQQALTEKLDRIYGVRVDDNIVSLARSTAECPGLAMLVGVGTLKSFRNLGYAKQSVAKLTADLLAEDKTPCLFYDNPIAAKIYEQLGFERIARWIIVRL